LYLLVPADSYTAIACRKKEEVMGKLSQKDKATFKGLTAKERVEFLQKFNKRGHAEEAYQASILAAKTKALMDQVNEWAKAKDYVVVDTLYGKDRLGVRLTVLVEKGHILHEFTFEKALIEGTPTKNLVTSFIAKAEDNEKKGVTHVEEKRVPDKKAVAAKGKNGCAPEIKKGKGKGKSNGKKK
jgi:hypothetical protein